MLYEKKKILIHRSIWLALLVLAIIIEIIVSCTPSKDVEIVSNSGHINTYYESLDETSCEIEVVFDCKVDPGYIWVAFYDSNGKLLSKVEGYFYGYDNTVSSTFFIDGKVDSYEILSYDIHKTGVMSYIPLSNLIIIYVNCDLIILIFFICALRLSYKIYEYDGNNILVYAGWYHHYIKVNDAKMDEHSTLISFAAIPLSCTLDDGTDIKVTITMANRISLKINNQLYKEKKL